MNKVQYANWKWKLPIMLETEIYWNIFVGEARADIPV